MMYTPLILNLRQVLLGTMFLASACASDFRNDRARANGVSGIALQNSGDGTASNVLPSNAEIPKIFGNSGSYAFSIHLVSGSQAGSIASGYFIYDKNSVHGQGIETTPVTFFTLDYQATYYRLENLDAAPQVTLKDGHFLSIASTGGPQTKRFGINAGFQREQFQRREEIFARQGGQYFGYLDTNTYVDGAGTISYSDASVSGSQCQTYTGTQCYWMENTSGNYCWVPAAWAADQTSCKEEDSCNGGGGASGGGCYKWGDSSQADDSRFPSKT